MSERVPITGIGIHALTLAEATNLIVERARNRGKGYVCFADVNSVMSAHRDPSHRQRLEEAWLVTPDGMPIVWLARKQATKSVTRVYGPDVLEAVCAATAGTELTHYFFGAGPGTAEALADALVKRFPGLKVAGTETPPFRPLTEPEAESLRERMSILKPSFLWVGLSTPKQERFMHGMADLDVGVMLGVGAAFDFLSGRVRQAPRWIQRSGLEWLFRLSAEPRRLWKRYFVNVPAFFLKVITTRNQRSPHRG